MVQNFKNILCIKIHNHPHVNDVSLPLHSDIYLSKQLERDQYNPKIRLGNLQKRKMDTNPKAKTKQRQPIRALGMGGRLGCTNAY